MMISKEAWLTTMQRVRAFVYVRGEKKKYAKFSTMLFVFLCIDCFLFS